MKLRRARNGTGSISNGYRILPHNGERVPEHRIVMEGVLGRPLLDTEIVHHVDGNKLHNSPDNLVITNRADHAQYHATKLFRDATRKQCSNCREIKPRTQFDRKNRGGEDPNNNLCKPCKRSYRREYHRRTGR